MDPEPTVGRTCCFMRRVVVKVGSSSLTNGRGALAADRLAKLSNEIAAVHALPSHIILVTSGAVATGVGHLGWRRESITVPEKQAAAAVGQGLLMDAYQRNLHAHGISLAQLLLTRSDIEDRKRFVHIRNTLETLLKNRIVPIINENDSVAVDEIRFGDNDNLASMVALLAQADLLILLTDIDGLYSADPRTCHDAVVIPHVFAWTPEIIAAAGERGSSNGTGGMRTKLQAARRAGQAGIETVIASSLQQDVVMRILSGEELGTRFHSSHARRSDKRTWLRVRSHADGDLLIDEGAALALADGASSLLLPGIVEVKGHFDEGAVVDVWSADNSRVGRGAVSYCADDLRLLLARRQGGEQLSVPEVIHRNELIIWSGGEP